MNFIDWLQSLGRDADPAQAGFQARLLYVVICAAMPVLIGVLVGVGLRTIERIFGIELGKGGH
jgi:lipopolysaccharide export LptBFGC system permease protein LptF